MRCEPAAICTSRRHPSSCFRRCTVDTVRSPLVGLRPLEHSGKQARSSRFDRHRCERADDGKDFHNSSRARKHHLFQRRSTSKVKTVDISRPLTVAGLTSQPCGRVPWNRAAPPEHINCPSVDRRDTSSNPARSTIACMRSGGCTNVSKPFFRARLTFSSHITARTYQRSFG